MERLLATLVDYPRDDYRQTLEKVLSEVRSSSIFDPDLKAEFYSFAQFVQETDVSDLEEAYTSTFDINGMCSLDVGFVLFGEDYKRGEFLVHVSRLQREYDNPVGSELADHLPNMLRLLDKMGANPAAKEQRLELVEKIYAPAVQKMIATFQGSQNHFQVVLKLVLALLNYELDCVYASRGAIC